jgi:hypothetical protein
VICTLKVQWRLVLCEKMRFLNLWSLLVTPKQNGQKGIIWVFREK